MGTLELFRCRVCGGELEDYGAGKYKCAHCNAVYKEKDVKAYAEEIRKAMKGEVTDALEAQRTRDIANARQNLFREIQEKYINSYDVIGCCREVKKYLPNDFQANAFEILNKGNKKEINRFLDSIDVKSEARFYISDIVEFMLKSLVSSNVLPLKSLVDRAYTGDEKTEYLTRIEDEAAKYNDGLYDPNLTRDAFIAYSSADMESVNKIVDDLEETGLKCFVAMRNLRHGRGAVENYEANLAAAMQHCRCFVFLSSHNSRRFDCDAVAKEIYYVRDNVPKIKRIEYILEDYDGRDSGIKGIMKDFFDLEQRRTVEDLIASIAEAKAKRSTSAEGDVKYCVACGTANGKTAKFCFECGKSEFVATYGEYQKLREQRIREEAERKVREELEQKLAEERCLREEAELKAKEESRRAKAETERLTREKVEAERKAKADADRKAKAETERLVREKAEVERKAKEETDRRATEETERRTTTEGFPFIHRILGNGSVSKSITCQADSVTKTMPASQSNVAVSVKPQTIVPTDTDFPTLQNCDRDKFDIDGTVLKKYRGTDSEVQIPYGVTSISKQRDWRGVFYVGAFQDRNYLESIVIPDTVTDIEDRAFKNCTLLKSIVIPNSVTSIGEEAFFGCASLKSIVIPNSVTTIGNLAFYGCKSLKSIVIPNSVTTIGKMSFDGCHSLTSLVIPNGITEIGSSAFAYCYSLKCITIPNSVTEIGESAFSYCTSLEGIVLPNSVTNIENRTFFGCCSLENITVEKGNKVYHSEGNCLIETESKTLIVGCKNSVIPTDGSVTGIGECAFYDCTSLESIALPDSLTHIGKEAFKYCSSLEKIIIPKSVIKMDASSFEDCENLTIYCRISRFKKPSGWGRDWNNGRKVVWGYKGK